MWLVLLVVAFGAGGAYYLFGRTSAPTAVSGEDGNGQMSIDLAIPEQNAPPVPAAEASTGNALPMPGESAPGQQAPAVAVSDDTGNSTDDFVLPELKNSDAVFKEDLNKLSSNLAKWINTEQYIVRYLTLINDFSQGQRIYKHANFLRVEKAFTPKRNAFGFFMDASDYRRYDQFATAVESLDVQACMALYKKYRPLMQEVFASFGYPHNFHIEDIIQKAGAAILQAPLIDRPLGLTPHGNRFKFADPQLEGLGSVQKQMLRMGPENTKRIQAKVRALLQAFAA
jgi:hypothetical protein